MSDPASAFRPRFPRLRAAGRAVVRQWTVFVFAACYGYGQPGRPAATVCAAIVFFWVKGLIETYRVTVTFCRREEASVPPLCFRCPRAAAPPSANSLN